MDRQAIRSSLEGDRSRTFATRWLGPFAVLSRVNALSYVIAFPADRKCHRTVNIGFLKKFREAPNFSRTLPHRRASRTASDQPLDAMEVLDSRATTRRGRTKREYLIRYSGERQVPWIGEDQLKQMLSPFELASLLRPLGLGGGGSSIIVAAAQ